MDIRRATLAEVREMAAWADAEGWTPGLCDAAAFHAADPEGFFVAEVGGEMAACLSVVNHSPAFAFLGLYICRPDLRGRGIGYALWQAGLGHAGDRVVGLDGVAAQEANYARSGFVRSGATVRHEGPLAARPDPDIRPVAPDDLPDLMALDRAATGVDRPAFLRAWLTPTATRQAVCLPDGRGLAVIRRCGRGVKLGPVLAADAETALRLIRAGLCRMPEAPVIVDVPEGGALADRLAALGFVPTFATARMYRGPAPRGDGRQQAIATMELG
jgi:GNAT superfamily N-acetyltransferase